MSADQSDRDGCRAAILRRRAFFVGSALTALGGCSSQGTKPQKPNPIVGVEPASSSAPKQVEPAASAPTPSPALKMPSLAIPKDVKSPVRGLYEDLAARVPRIHTELDRANAALDGICDITDPACDAAWLRAARHLAEADRAVTDLPPLCPATSAAGKAYEARLNDHVIFIGDRRQAVRDRIDALLPTEPAKARWKLHLDSATEPMPCLDFSCHDW